MQLRLITPHATRFECRVPSGHYQYRVYLFVSNISRAHSSFHLSVSVVYIAYCLYTLALLLMIVYGLTNVNFGLPELISLEVGRNEWCDYG